MSEWLDPRMLVIAACGASAGIHAGLAPHHWGESRAIGVLFVLAAVALAVVSLGLAGWPEASLPPFAAAGLFAALIAAFIAAGESLDAIAVVTKVIEAVGFVLALLVLLRPPGRPNDLALAYFGLAFTLAFVIAAASGHSG